MFIPKSKENGLSSSYTPCNIARALDGVVLFTMLNVFFYLCHFCFLKENTLNYIKEEFMMHLSNESILESLLLSFILFLVMMISCYKLENIKFIESNSVPQHKRN